MITYDPENGTNSNYVISYQSLREDYTRYIQMSDGDFRTELVKALHFACVVCWFKELQTQWLLGDTGLIHELVHLLEGFYDGNDAQFRKIREQFAEQCKLA